MDLKTSCRSSTTTQPSSKPSLLFLNLSYFCLRPSAKDQGITLIVDVVILAPVLVLVHHLVQFLFNRNLSEKYLPDWELNCGPSAPQPST